MQYGFVVYIVLENGQDALWTSVSARPEHYNQTGCLEPQAAQRLFNQLTANIDEVNFGSAVIGFDLVHPLTEKTNTTFVEVWEYRDIPFQAYPTEGCCGLQNGRMMQRTFVRKMPSKGIAL